MLEQTPQNMAGTGPNYHLGRFESSTSYNLERE